MLNPAEEQDLQDATVALASALGAIESARYFSGGRANAMYAMLVERATELCEDITAMLEPAPNDTLLHLTAMEGARA